MPINVDAASGSDFILTTERSKDAGNISELITTSHEFTVHARSSGTRQSLGLSMQNLCVN